MYIFGVCVQDFLEVTVAIIASKFNSQTLIKIVQHERGAFIRELECH